MEDGFGVYCSSDDFFCPNDNILDFEKEKTEDDPEWENFFNKNLFKYVISSECLLPQSELKNLDIFSSSISSCSPTSPLNPSKSFASPTPHTSSSLLCFSLSSLSSHPFHSSSPTAFENPNSFFPIINHSSSEKVRPCKNRECFNYVDSSSRKSYCSKKCQYRFFF
jgi:hypothetical protein